MNKLKRILSLLVAVLMIVGVFSACGKETLPEGITSLKKAKVGDLVNLGNYEQDNNNENGKEKVTWLVLAIEGKKAFLVSEKVLDTKKYKMVNNGEYYDADFHNNLYYNDNTYNERLSIKERLILRQMQ